jgi:uncharacterized protein YneF (UPF0154 family)
MKKYILLSILLAVFLGTFVSVKASEGELQKTEVLNNNTNLNREIIKNESKDRVKQIRVDSLNPLNNTREDIRLRLEEKEGKTFLNAREEFRQRMEERRLEFRTSLQEKIAEMKNLTEQERLELKSRLQQISDERKKLLVERIYQQLNSLNERLLNHYLNLLEVLDKNIIKIEERINRAEERGANVLEARRALEEAVRSIENARSVIKAQAEKKYSIEITTEQNLKTDLGKTRQLLHNDLIVVRAAVRSAYEAVRKAATTLTQI